MTLHQKSPELLPPAAADCATGVRLIKIHKEHKSSITNRPARSTYPKKKSVLTSGATPPKRILAISIRYPVDRGAQAAVVEKLDALREQTISVRDIYERKLVKLDDVRASLLREAFAGC